MNKRDKKLASPIQGFGLGVNVIGGDIKFALREFKRQVKKAGLIDELYRRKFYEKPSSKRKKVVEDAKYRNRRDLQKTK